MLQTVFYLVKLNECSLKLLLAWLSMRLIYLGLDKSIMHVLSFDIIYEDTVSPGGAYLSSFFLKIILGYSVTLGSQNLHV